MGSLVFLALMMLVLYFFLLRPQQRARQQFQQLQRSIAEGDQVVTSGGIYGNVVQVDDDAVWLEVAPDVEIKVARGAIGKRLEPAATEVTEASGPAIAEPTPDSEIDQGASNERRGDD